MSETVLIIICLLSGLAAGALIVFLVFLARPRAAAPDTAAVEGLAQITARIDAMGSWLHKTQGQLQQTMHERLDAATARTSDHLQQLHARLAVIDSAQQNLTEPATQVQNLQQ